MQNGQRKRTRLGHAREKGIRALESWLTGIRRRKGGKRGCVRTSPTYVCPYLLTTYIHAHTGCLAPSPPLAGGGGGGGGDIRS